VAGAAAEQEAQEVFLQARVAAGAPLRGTYPPNADVLGEWEAHRAAGTAAGNGEGAA
jgi:hypothetical protein